jgi:hypothetical protein
MSDTPVDNRGKHWNVQVANAQYETPARHVKAWKDTADRMEAELKRKGLEHMLKNITRNSGRCRRAIYMYLVICNDNGLVTLELEDKEPSFFGIKKFVINDREAFDSGPDEIGEIHTVKWAEENARRAQVRVYSDARVKTIRKHWADIGMMETEDEATGRLVYTFYPNLLKKHIERMKKDSAKRISSPKGGSAIPPPPPSYDCFGQPSTLVHPSPIGTRPIPAIVLPPLLPPVMQEEEADPVDFISRDDDALNVLANAAEGLERCAEKEDGSLDMLARAAGVKDRRVRTIRGMEKGLEALQDRAAEVRCYAFEATGTKAMDLFTESDKLSSHANEMERELKRMKRGA